MRTIGNLFALAVLSISTPAFAESVVYYCGPEGNEGAMLKVDFKKKVVCLGAGQARANYCSGEFATSMKIVATRDGSLKFGNDSVAFTEVIARSDEGKSQMVRLYHPTAGTSPAEYTIHHADLLGELSSLAPVKNPKKQLRDGDSSCISGDSGSIE